MMDWVHDKPAPKRRGRQIPKLQQGYAASTEPKSEVPPDWVKDGKTGLYLPETARPVERRIGFG